MERRRTDQLQLWHRHLDQLLELPEQQERQRQRARQVLEVSFFSEKKNFFNLKTRFKIFVVHSHFKLTCILGLKTFEYYNLTF
jgi:hypothetical protein